MSDTKERPDKTSILKNHQVVDDTMIDYKNSWENLVKDSSRRLTRTEAALLDKLGPFDLLELDEMRTLAEKSSQDLFAGAKPSEGSKAFLDKWADKNDRTETFAGNFWRYNDGHQDAVRHCYFNAMATSQFGPDWVRAFSTAHEARPGNPNVAEAMDLYNNKIGRQIALDHPNASREELLEKVKEKYANGELLVIGRDGTLKWSDEINPGDHGLTPAGSDMKGRIELPDPRIHPGHTPSPAPGPSPGPQGGIPAAPAAVSLADPANMDHALFRDALSQLREQDRQAGRAPREAGEEVAAGIVAGAKAQGLDRIGALHVSADGATAWVTDTRDPAAAHARVASIDLQGAALQTLEANSAQMAQTVAEQAPSFPAEPTRDAIARR
jgi:hypothetical protein